jgi:hypothetical protein
MAQFDVVGLKLLNLTIEKLISAFSGLMSNVVALSSILYK